MALDLERAAALRGVLLGEDWLALPAAVRELAVAQGRTEEQLAALTARVEALAETQQRTEQR